MAQRKQTGDEKAATVFVFSFLIIDIAVFMTLLRAMTAVRASTRQCSVVTTVAGLKPDLQIRDFPESAAQTADLWTLSIVMGYMLPITVNLLSEKPPAFLFYERPAYLPRPVDVFRRLLQMPGTVGQGRTQPVLGTKMYHRFRWLQAIKNEESGKPRFPLPWLKKSIEGLFQHPAKPDGLLNPILKAHAFYTPELFDVVGDNDQPQ